MIAGKNDMLDERSISSGCAVFAEFAEGNEQANRNEILTLAAAEGLVTQLVVQLWI
jgi:hypothetical protein